MEPLTMEELSNMDGQPVWIQTESERGKWYLVCATRIKAVQLVDAHGAFHKAEDVLENNAIWRSPIAGKKKGAHMTSKVERHRELCLKLNELYVKKNHDYGDSFKRTLQTWGPAAAEVRMSDKLNRFVALSKSAAEVDDESVVDTLLDLANYAIMSILELEAET